MTKKHQKQKKTIRKQDKTVAAQPLLRHVLNHIKKNATMHADHAGSKYGKSGRSNAGSTATDPDGIVMDTYDYFSGKIPIKVTVLKEPGQFVPIYRIQISAISPTTEVILEKVRQELIKRVSLGISDISDTKKTDLVEEKFEELISILIEKYFPDSDQDSSNFLKSYLKINSLGLGSIELLMNDENLEELVVNAATEPVWVYHKKHGWLKTTVFLKSEEQTKHYASIIGRRVGRQITVLTPLLDAHLETGDRVNATLSPISTAGNTITIRKFSKDPWTITKFLKTRTLTLEAAALIWMSIQYELSCIIAGGTASGKTSALNVFANFFPPNQRIISIEDTREIILPKYIHWVPLNTTLPNAEGKGEINMGDLLVNSLRMRPDRILVGEVRRRRETETLFEAIHTGHSVYATFHANSAKETVERLTNAPIEIPRIMLPAISMIIVQFRNRRSGQRRTFQIAEILPNGESNVMLQYDAKKDALIKISKSKSLFDNISLFTGMSTTDIERNLKEKISVLNYLVKKNIEDVHDVGRIMAEYYTNKDDLMRYVNTGKDLPPQYYGVDPHDQQKKPGAGSNPGANNGVTTTATDISAAANSTVVGAGASKAFSAEVAKAAKTAETIETMEHASLSKKSLHTVSPQNKSQDAHSGNPLSHLERKQSSIAPTAPISPTSSVHLATPRLNQTAASSGKDVGSREKEHDPEERPRPNPFKSLLRPLAPSKPK